MRYQNGAMRYEQHLVRSNILPSRKSVTRAECAVLLVLFAVIFALPVLVLVLARL